VNFKNWQNYRDKSEELNLYVKSHLKELRLKPKKEAIPEIHRVYTGGHWKDFEFYKIEDTELIKEKKKIIIRDLDITPENLCKSLYVINKSAKKSRDTKQANYYRRNFGVVSRAKGRQNDLYSLKNSVINKMIENNLIYIKGYHIQNLDGENYLLLYSYGDNYTFHVLADKEDVENINYLGDIDHKISSEVKIKTNIKFNEALNLLERYIDL
jgi:hypothetical protein